MTQANASDNSLKIIIPSVLLLHACALLLLLTFSQEHPPLPLPKKLVVSSIKLKPVPKVLPKNTPIAQTAPLPQNKEIQEVKAEPKQEAKEAKKEEVVVQAPKVEKKPTPKKPPPKPKAAPNPAPKPTVTKKPPEKTKPTKTPVAAAKPPTPKAPPLEQKQKELLSKAMEKIGKIDTASDKVIATGNLSKTLPKTLAALSIDSLSVEAAPSMGFEELAYRDELAMRLKLQLKLPEYGEVKLKLKVERSGKVLDVNIVKSTSEKNSAFIKKTLPTLSMPPFGNQFKGESSYTFTITLSND